MIFRSILARAALAALLAIASTAANAHCDALDGPVVRDARAALEKRDPGAVLKWVAPEAEEEIRKAFAKTLTVRALGEDAQRLADQWFFETLVRVHRAGEGEPFTGLKPAGQIDPGLAAADAALDSRSAVELGKELSRAIEAGVRSRFDLALARKQHIDSAAAGRAYVAAYVDYAHFVESVHRLAEKGAPHTHTEGH